MPDELHLQTGYNLSARSCLIRLCKKSSPRQLISYDDTSGHLPKGSIQGGMFLLRHSRFNLIFIFIFLKKLMFNVYMGTVWLWAVFHKKFRMCVSGYTAGDSASGPHKYLHQTLCWKESWHYISCDRGSYS